MDDIQIFTKNAGRDVTQCQIVNAFRPLGAEEIRVNYGERSTEKQSTEKQSTEKQSTEKQGSHDIEDDSSSIDTDTFTLDIVKYSGRVAEGIRGNSRERSSLEFINNSGFDETQISVTPTCWYLEQENVRRNSGQRSTKEQILKEFVKKSHREEKKETGIFYTLRTYLLSFLKMFTKNKPVLQTDLKKTMKKNKNDPTTLSFQENVKYSERVAEGIRGNSGERSSEEFIQHKRELMNIHQMLSVSHIHNPANRKTKHPSSPEVITGQPMHTSQKVELLWEFLWCFPCCYYLKNLGCITRMVQTRSFETTTNTCQVSVYDTVHNVFYAPLFDNEQIRQSNLQKMVLVIRFCFELYKTMIGSYLTVFTPQDCDGVVCTLRQNLIPKDNLEILALTMNSFMAFSLLSEYVIEIARERILRMYFENDQRLPVEKEYFTNLLGILDTKKASLLGEKSKMITLVFHLYRKVGIILLSLYVVNVSISGIVIYKNYYDKSSLFGFVTNALFIVLKMVSILKIAIHSINMPYSAYIETPVAFNSLKPEYIKGNVKKHFLFGLQGSHNEHIHYFDENKQYIRFLLDDYGTENTVCLDIDEVPTLRHRNSFG
jgi:hypothetical protein